MRHKEYLLSFSHWSTAGNGWLTRDFVLPLKQLNLFKAWGIKGEK